jgi:hypothetical protein
MISVALVRMGNDFENEKNGNIVRGCMGRKSKWMWILFSDL